MVTTCPSQDEPAVAEASFDKPSGLAFILFAIFDLCFLFIFFISSFCFLSFFTSHL